MGSLIKRWMNSTGSVTQSGIRQRRHVRSAWDTENIIDVDVEVECSVQGVWKCVWFFVEFCGVCVDKRCM